MTTITDATAGIDATIAIQADELVPPCNLPHHAGARPDPQWRRGRCPKCGGTVVSSMVWVTKPSPGYAIIWECWNRRHIDDGGQTVLPFEGDGGAPVGLGTGWARCDYARVL